ncbi:hypothetical protein [Lacunimicrobium album]
MPSETITSLRETLTNQSPEQAIEQLIATQSRGRDAHGLLMARLLKHRYELGLPLTRLTSFDDVPNHFKDEFERRYIAELEKLGHELLDKHEISQAWQYFRVINQPGPVADAIAKVPADGAHDDQSEEIIQIAVYELVNPAHGLKMMLRSSGMCNTVTAFDQIYLQMSLPVRMKAAAFLVEAMHEELTHAVRRHVEEKVAMLPPDMTLRELIVQFPWVFEAGGYHTDLSHLSSVIRFARCLASEASQLTLLDDLLFYGEHLNRDLLPHSDPPFGDFFVAHRHFFDVVSGKDVEGGVGYFRQQMEQADEDQDRSLSALVVIDLLARLKQYEQAGPLVLQYLTDERVHGSAFNDFCRDAKQFGLLKQHAESTNNPLLYLTAELEERRAAGG